jgi:predicted PurR-regulated permease PerM
VGFVVASIIVIVALAAVSEIVLPMTFAAVLAIVFKPLVRILERHKVWPALAAGIIVLGLLAVVTGVIIATVRGVTQQADQISGVADKALHKAADLTDAVGVDQSSLDALRKAVDDAAPMITTGFLSGLVSGFGTVIAVVSGVILGALIMYYLLKDGTHLRRAIVGQVDPEFRNDLDDFIGDSCRVLRDYGKGRTVMSAIVAVAIGLVALLLGLPLVFTIIVVNFIGGYIPYIGAFLGGGLAVIIALGDGGLPKAAVMLVVVLAANLVLENFVEPKVMGADPRHPPARCTHRHRIGWPLGRHRRPHPGRARDRNRRRRHHSPAVERHPPAGGQTRPAGRTTPARLTWMRQIRRSSASASVITLSERCVGRASSAAAEIYATISP